MILIHKIASWYISRRLQRIQEFWHHPVETQQHVLDSLLLRAKDTVWGKNFGYEDIHSLDTFRNRVPISSYEALFPWIQRTINGEENILWPGKTEWFAKSSGTTNDKSKFIPVTDASFEETHFEAGKDMLALYFDQRPESRLFSGKILSITGSHQIQGNGDTRAGDLSALLSANLPFFYKLVRAPSKKVAFLSEWETKIEAITNEVIDADLTAFAGVPTWTLVMINRIIERLEKEGRTFADLWPNLEVFFHGGVNFEPYRKQFEMIFPGDQMSYLNIYNASEGFFGLQDDLSRRDMLLMLDYGVFYEFIPFENIEDEHPQTYTLGDVELGRNYAMVISTNGGLWRYVIGDTVAFTSKNPFRIRITGRTKHFINAFGEELMVDNAEEAMTIASKETGAVIENYTAGPIFFEGNDQGGHEWLIEFCKQPDDVSRFMEILDETLKSLNSDYEAKRFKSMALRFPLLRNMPEGTFFEWMKQRGKLGGQNKVPRLSNDRRYIDSIYKIATPSTNHQIIKSSNPPIS